MGNTKTIEHVHRSFKAKKIIMKSLLIIVTYVLALIYFFPILYMALTGFKTEYQAVNPSLLFVPTLETFKKVLSDSSFYTYLNNSIFQVLIGTIFCLLLGVPAAFILAFGKFKKPSTNGNIYFWFITTILLPPVAILIPLYTMYQKVGLNKTPIGLLLTYIGFNVPIVVWLVYAFFKDIPNEIIESSALDGCTRMQQLTRIALPLARIGIVTAALLVIIFIWNEFFLGFNLTTNETATLPVYLSRFREQEGLFTAQLCASSTIAVLPVLILGWISQKSLVKGLTMGAVKG
jgi:sorbitol/mannitol transport system permease protein